MVMYREVCPEGVQNKCPGGIWCRGFMSWGDTLILVISRGVQLYYGIAQCTGLVGPQSIYRSLCRSITMHASLVEASHIISSICMLQRNMVLRQRVKYCKTVAAPSQAESGCMV